MGHWDVSSGKGTCHQAKWKDFDHQNLHGKELNIIDLESSNRNPLPPIQQKSLAPYSGGWKFKIKAVAESLSHVAFSTCGLIWSSLCFVFLFLFCLGGVWSWFGLVLRDRVSLCISCLLRTQRNPPASASQRVPAHKHDDLSLIPSPYGKFGHSYTCYTCL